MPIKETVTIEGLVKMLREDYDMWKDIYVKGCNDPYGSDGVNINLKRNHILYDKMQMEKLLMDQYHLYPDIYFLPTPPVLPYDYAARDREHGGKQYKCSRVLPYDEIMVYYGQSLVEKYMCKSTV